MAVPNPWYHSLVTNPFNLVYCFHLVSPTRHDMPVTGPALPKTRKQATKNIALLIFHNNGQADKTQLMNKIVPVVTYTVLSLPNRTRKHSSFIHLNLTLPK